MQKIAKNSPSAHHSTPSSGCIFATKACIDNRKNWLNSNISSRCPQNMANFGPLTAEIGLPVWGTPANFNGFRILVLLLQRRRSPEVSQTLHDVWSSPGLLHYTYIFGGFCPDRILPCAKFTLCPSLRSHILAALLHGTLAAGLSQTLQCGTRNGISELSQMAPPIFGWAAIMLGISPNSSYSIFNEARCSS